MNQQEVNKLSLGLYKIYWKSGRQALASVGHTHSGRKWYACCNWVCDDDQLKIASSAWQFVDRVILIKSI